MGPDGEGPEPELLVVGGYFAVAGDVLANCIAAWDGNTWQALGAGVHHDENAGIHALTVYNGELIAGGFFTTAGGAPCNHIARWDGSTWQPLGAGIGDEYDSVGQGVCSGSVRRGANCRGRVLGCWRVQLLQHCRVGW